MSGGGLAALGAQYSDSENEDEFAEQTEPLELTKIKHGQYLLDPKIQSASNSPASFLGSTMIESLNRNVRIVNEPSSQNPSQVSELMFEDDYEDNRPSSPIAFHESLMNVKPEEIKIPAEPNGRCSDSLLAKFDALHDRMKKSGNMVASIQKRKDFRNPSIYEKLISYCNIDEFGSNYPPDIYDPSKFGPESYYEELARKQKEDVDKRDKERKERTKVDFVTGTAKKTATIDSGGGPVDRKKSKWDVAGGNNPNVGSLISSSTGKVSSAPAPQPSVLVKSNLASVISKLKK